MQEYETEIINDRLFVKGFPQAAKTFEAVSPSQARDLADLSLHRHDLLRSREYLEALQQPVPEIVQEALWHSAIVSYCKCFAKSNARGVLKSNAILRSGPKKAGKAHNLFMAVRDKHVAHDDNALLDAKPGFIFALPESSYKIERIVCAVILAETFSQEWAQPLWQLVNTALAWVDTEFEKLCEQATARLEPESFDLLNAQPDAVYRKPEIRDLFSTRRTITS